MSALHPSPPSSNPKLAPQGKALVHAYVAANEPYSRWEGMDRKGDTYKQQKVGLVSDLAICPVLLCASGPEFKPHLGAGVLCHADFCQLH